MELNSVLKSWDEVNDAVRNLESIGLQAHPHKIKSWDTWKIISFVNNFGKHDSYILDVGCNGSPILSLLQKLRFQNLYGCDVDLSIRKRRILRRVLNKISSKEPDAILNELLENKENLFHLSIQDLEKTNYRDSMFDFISSLSVIEHGVNLENYFSEMSRILKPGGYLLTSTDYWENKIDTISNVYNRPGNDVIFDKKEIEEILTKARKFNFKLYQPLNFESKDKVMKWKKTNKKYTFIFFCLQKTN